MPATKKTVDARRARVATILPVLKATYPDARCSLDFASPFQLVVATVLSAQCTDARVNKTTPALFARYPTPRALAESDPADVEQLVKSCGTYRAKAKNLRALAAALVEKHGDEVPATMGELVALAGVGRKTANVVLGNAFGTDVGVTVDTHVARVSGRLGLTRHNDPVKIEADLMPIVPREDWCAWSHLLIAHGRAVCAARKPRCGACPVLGECPTGQANVLWPRTPIRHLPITPRPPPLPRLPV